MTPYWTLPPLRHTTLHLLTACHSDLRGFPLPVSTLWARDSLVNRRTYTLACGPVLGTRLMFPKNEARVGVRDLPVSIAP